MLQRWCYVVAQNLLKAIHAPFQVARVARVAKQFTARTVGGVICGVKFFVEDDLENDVFVCGSRWFVYVPDRVLPIHSE